MHTTVRVVQQRKQGSHVLVQLLCYNNITQMHITVRVVQQRKQGSHVLVQLLCYNNTTQMHITVCVVQQRKQGRHVLVQLLCYNKELSKRAEASSSSNTNYKKRTQMSVVFQIFMPPCLKFDFNSSICTSSFKCGQLFKNLLSLPAHPTVFPPHASQ